MKDLIVSVADTYQEKVLEALLPRLSISSDTRQFSYDIIKNPAHDSGSFNDSHELLRPFIHQYNYALVIFDFDGSGAENLTSIQIENEVKLLLNKNGWNERNEVIVIQPELEIWMWLDNPNVEDAIGWVRNESLYTWARNNGYLGQHQLKPPKPKETLELALRISETSKSAAIYKKIVSKVSYQKCKDHSFIKLIRTLELLFPKI